MVQLISITLFTISSPLFITCSQHLILFSLNVSPNIHQLLLYSSTYRSLVLLLPYKSIPFDFLECFYRPRAKPSCNLSISYLNVSFFHYSALSDPPTIQNLLPHFHDLIPKYNQDCQREKDESGEVVQESQLSKLSKNAVIKSPFSQSQSFKIHITIWFLVRWTRVIQRVVALRVTPPSCFAHFQYKCNSKTTENCWQCSSDMTLPNPSPPTNVIRDSFPSVIRSREVLCILPSISVHTTWSVIINHPFCHLTKKKKAISL